MHITLSSSLEVSVRTALWWSKRTEACRLPDNTIHDCVRR